MSRSSSLILRLPLPSAALAVLVAACGDGDGGGVSAAIRSFCTRYEASSAFSCCQSDDRAQPAFGLRYRYASANDCINVLSAQEASAAGRQVFDGAAADACIAHLNARQCGVVVTEAVARAELEAGCARVLSGRAAEGQQCQSPEDCALGLVCPPVADTGSATCAKPATENQDCFGQQARSVDHPACVEGLICSFVGENPAGCPTPPCQIFKCVPPFDAGEPCSANECAQGLVCRDGTCQSGAPNGVGGACRVLEHCQPGLYCDTASQTCAERRAAGADCRVGNNALYECKGICRGEGDFGTCAAFCGN